MLITAATVSAVVAGTAVGAVSIIGHLLLRSRLLKKWAGAEIGLRLVLAMLDLFPQQAPWIIQLRKMIDQATATAGPIPTSSSTRRHASGRSSKPTACPRTPTAPPRPTWTSPRRQWSGHSAPTTSPLSPDPRNTAELNKGHRARIASRTRAFRAFRA